MGQDLTLGIDLTLRGDLGRDIEKAIQQHLRQSLVKSKSPVLAATRKIVREAMLNCPEFLSLKGGALQAQLGVKNPLPVMNAIVAMIQSGVKVRVSPIGLVIDVLVSPIQPFLGISGGKFLSAKGKTVAWLEWLLTFGNRPAVWSWKFRPGPAPSSRTGLGIMVRATGSWWKVPSPYAGVPVDNFIHRALNLSLPKLEKQIVQIFTEKWDS